MNTKQAKDLVVEEAAKQAALENVPLSDIEKKMMYFTESDTVSCENPIQLNDELEAQYDTPEYEAYTMSRLLNHAYQRVKAEDPELPRSWDDAVRVLRKGDHYLLVLLSTGPSDHPTRDFIVQVGIGVLIALGIFIVMVLCGTMRSRSDAPRATN